MASGFEGASQTPTPPAQAPAPAFPSSAEDVALPNESPFQGFIRNVRKCGRESAMGKDSLPNLVGYIAEAVNNGALNPNEKWKGADGKDVNAANFIFNVYSTEEGKKAVHERSKLSTRAQVSKINKVIQASAKPNVNFRGVLQRALEMRAGMITKHEKGAVKSAFDHYVSLAREQIKKDTDLSPAEIETAGLRGDAEANTIQKEFIKMHKKLKKLLSGENKDELKVGADDVLYEEMVAFRDALLAAIRIEEPGYDVPKPEAQPASQMGAQAPAQGAQVPAQGAQGSAFEMQPQQPQQPAQQPQQ